MLKAHLLKASRLRRRITLFLCSFLIVGLTAVPSWASSPILMQLSGPSSGSNSLTMGVVKLDGYEVFKIAAPQSTVGYRSKQIQENLEAIQEHYLSIETPDVRITTQRMDGEQPQVYVNGDYLMTITQEDANLQGTTTGGLVNRLNEALSQALVQSYEERQPNYRERQYLYGGIALGLAVLAMILLRLLSTPLLRWLVGSVGSRLGREDNTEDYQRHLVDIRQLLIPIFDFSFLAAAALWITGRFPETRAIQGELLSALKVPIIIIIVALVAYVGVRLTYAFVDKLLISMTDEEGLSGYYSRRTRLRISTLSSVIKNIANFIWIALGFVLALTITGVNLGLLLASVGIIGLALSLAAQNLAQGAIKGFFIVLEDQFAIGDIVQIGEDAGVVENLNLRITQLRDAEGRVITIPTNEINRVANYSLLWSRADLKLPVHYNADIDRMIDISREVGNDLKNDPDWSELILEDPQILGVDDFGDSALIIRVWIKTKPMKQWDVSREYRRRFKLALQETDVSMPFPQRDVWLHPSDELMINLKGDGASAQNGSNGKSSGKPKTDRQPRNVPDDTAEEADGGAEDGSDR